MRAIQYQMPEQEKVLAIASEPEVMYITKEKLKTFSIESFQALSQKLLFTQLEWADILHISDRTLQRYLKEDKPFEGLFSEHLYQLDNMAALGLTVFSDAKGLEEWLRTPKTILGKTIDFSTLQSFWGVKLICNELGRIEHGVYI
jgi:putative toxin-antitoxin system antitoxin component (TIGR02293 family)